MYLFVVSDRNKVLDQRSGALRRATARDCDCDCGDHLDNFVNL